MLIYAGDTTAMPAATVTVTVGRAAVPHTSVPVAMHAKQHMPCRTAWRPAAPQRLAWSREPFGCSKYDDPALYTSDDSFSEALYWDRRYQRDGQTFEWYRGYLSLEALLLTYFDPEQPLLQVGVGTSVLQLDMVEQAGFARIVNTDYSKVCIEAMAAAHAHLPQLEYRVGDAREMPEFEDASFSGVLDKGTLDALMCGDTAEEDASRMLSEVSRVLQLGGVYMMITSHPPYSRYRYIGRPAYGWAVHVYEVGQQGELQGPYKLAFDPDDEQAARAMELPSMSYSHFAYVCRKQGTAQADAAA